MRGAVCCRAASGPAAQPQTSGVKHRNSNRSSGGSSRARPPPLAATLLQRQLEPAADSPGPRPAVVFIPPPAAADIAAPAAASAGSSISLAGASRWHLASQQLAEQQQRWWDLEPELLPNGPSCSIAFDGETSSGAAAAAASSSSGSRFGVQLNEPPPRQQQQPPEERDKDFFANVGDAIRTLREDYPLLFAKDLDYKIYREDLVYKDPNLSFQGLRTYKIIFWSLRFHGKLFLQAAHVQVLRIWQPEDAVIKLRWQINAQPRLGGKGAAGTFDGISVYKLDSHGKVYQHEVTDVQMRDPPITNPVLYALNFILSPRPQTQQVPCPGSWYQDGDEEVLPEMLTTTPVLASSGSPE